MNRFPSDISRTRILIPSNQVYQSLSSKDVIRIVGNDLLFSCATFLSKHLLFDEGVGAFWVTAQVLLWGAFGSLVYVSTHLTSVRKGNTEWSAAGTLSVLLFIQIAAFFTALGRLSSFRVLVFSQLLTQAFRFCTSPPPSFKHVFACILGVSLTLFSEFSQIRFKLPGYLAILTCALASTAYDFTIGFTYSPVVSGELRVVSILGAAVFTIPLYFIRHTIQSSPYPALPYYSHGLPAVLAVAMLLVNPTTSWSTRTGISPGPFMASSFARFLLSAVIAFTSSSKEVTWLDNVIFCLLFYAFLPVDGRTAAHSASSHIPRLVRSYIKRVLSNSESSKIFYFLMLNLCYMLVQMLYGVWTNSLGLISDAIHMAFDCMAIAMGLLASVMATWRQNEQFTYGYARIETLSGFANGIFLILISIFIVFEAIERLMEPPEMDTSQLLLVSSLGLGVNLFGMFAMGGHHHGHSHSHGSDHGHSHEHGHSHHHSHHEAHSNKTEIRSAVHEKGAKSKHEIPDIKDTGAGFESPTHVDSNVGDGVTEHHSHSHGHSLSIPVPHTHKHEGHSHNMRGVFLHVMADTLGSVGVIISTLLIQFYGWTGFDPIASLFIAVLIVASVIPLVLDTGRVLALDLGSSESKVQQALSDLTCVEGVVSYSTARFWPKDSQSIVGSIHIQVSSVLNMEDNAFARGKGGARDHDIVGRVNQFLCSRITGLEELTIQIEIA